MLTSALRHPRARVSETGSGRLFVEILTSLATGQPAERAVPHGDMIVARPALPVISHCSSGAGHCDNCRRPRLSQPVNSCQGPKAAATGRLGPSTTVNC